MQASFLDGKVWKTTTAGALAPASCCGAAMGFEVLSHSRAGVVATSAFALVLPLCSSTRLVRGRRLRPWLLVFPASDSDGPLSSSASCPVWWRLDLVPRPCVWFACGARRPATNALNSSLSGKHSSLRCSCCDFSHPTSRGLCAGVATRRCTWAGIAWLERSRMCARAYLRGLVVKHSPRAHTYSMNDV